MFGRRKREEAAAAEAEREAERRALFARLAQRPENICPFLGLAGERTGYVDGVSDEHRCFAFGDPTPLSAEQQTRVCQERGYGNCPRYLRGVLVIPTEELEALRRPRAPLPEPVPPPPPAAEPARRRGSPILLLIAALVLLVGGVGAFLAFGPGFGTAIAPSPSASTSPSPEPTSAVTASPSAEPTVEPTSAPTEPPPTGSGPATPTPEPTPEAGDEFAFYEVSVGPSGFTLYAVDDAGEVVDTRSTSFGGFSFARVDPIEASNGDIYWETQDGALTGWSYLFPDSGDFRIRAVFLNDAGQRRSAYLSEDELTEFPEATPAP